MLNGPFAPLIILLLIAWSLSWKGFALWNAARHKQKVWFIALLVINTLGLLEIIYLRYFQKKPVWQDPAGEQ